MKKVVSFLASGRGSNFNNIARRIKAGEIDAELGVLIVDKKDAGAIDAAKELGMSSFFVDPKAYANREEHEKEIVRILDEHSTDLVVAAGYMRILTPYIIGRYRNRMINIHPALLPAFPGIHAQRQAFEYGVKIAGCTVHFIDEGTDTGPIILQQSVPVLAGDTEDTLSKRILEQEHIVFPEAVKLFCAGKLRIEGRKVIIIQ